MPFYKISEMEKVAVDLGQAVMRSVPGELMKAGSITYPVGGGPPPHFHPNEEQFVLMMEGKMNMILGDETRIVEKGDLIFIPRNTRHGIAIIEGPAVFFTVKSPGTASRRTPSTRSASARSRKRPPPTFFLYTLGAGHPMLRSIPAMG